VGGTAEWGAGSNHLKSTNPASITNDTEIMRPDDHIMDVSGRYLLIQAIFSCGQYGSGMNVRGGQPGSNEPKSRQEKTSYESTLHHNIELSILGK
jgi:hypothetical protein